MKKLALILIIILTSTFLSFAQNKENVTPKKTQVDLNNEVFAGYGGLSVWYFSNMDGGSFRYPAPYEDSYSNSNDDYNDPTSPGTFYIGFQRSVNPVVGVGFLFSYQYLQREGITHTYNYSGNQNIYVPVKRNDNLFAGLAKVNFTYYNGDFIKMYSGIGVGVTLDFATREIEGVRGTDRKILPAGQLTFAGLRFGRAFGGFVEFGIGTVGIINGGLSYKFGE